MPNQKIVIDLGFALLTAEKLTEGPRPEISVCLEKPDGRVIQDIALISQAVSKSDITADIPNTVSCLVWADKDSEDYTHEHIIERTDTDPDD